MVRNLRRHTKVIMFLVLAAFIALIFFRWGASISGSRATVKKDVIGKVGKKEIKYSEYKKYIDRRIENARLMGVNIDDKTYRTLMDSAWADLVADKIWEDFLRREYLSVSPSEVFEIIRRSPPPEFKNMPAFQTDGKFDYQKYLQWLADPRNTEYIRRMQEGLTRLLLQEKLRIEVASSIFITDIDKEYMLEKRKYGFKGILFELPYGSIKGVKEPTEEEMRAYYAENKATLKSPEVRGLSFVEFLFQFSKEDSMNAYNKAMEAYQLLKEGVDFDTVWENYTEYRSRSDRLEPLLLYSKPVREILDTLKVGSYTPPILVGNTYQIIKLLERKKDRVRTKIIVFYITPGEETLERTRKKAEDFVKLAKKIGFKKAADSLGYQHVEPPFWRKDEVFLPQVYNNEALATYMFKAKKQKEILPILRGKAGYYAFMVDTIIPAGVLPFEKLKHIVKGRIIKQRQKEKALKIMENLYSRLKNASEEQYSEILKEFPLVKMEEFDYKDFYEARRRKGSLFAGALLGLDVGEIYGVIEEERSAFIVKLKDRYINQEKEQDIVDKEATRIVQEISTRMIEIPEVEDYRDKLWR